MVAAGTPVDQAFTECLALEFGRVQIGDASAFEVQVFEGELTWLRLALQRDRSTVAFWSRKGESSPRWEAVVRELHRRLVSVPSDDERAVRTACAFSPWRWDFCGFCIPDPVAHEASSEVMGALALSGREP
ncbi:hypothetical protein BH09MYX1_BH09MYX1_09420 [soil metagenome]